MPFMIYPPQPPEFQWTDDLVLEFARFTNSESSAMNGRYTDLATFKVRKTKRDWEIVEFSAKYWGHNEVRFSRGNDGSYGAGVNGIVVEEPIEKLLANGKIHSVRRLSDGEVFSVGDMIDYGCISGFSIEKDEMIVASENTAADYRIGLNRIKKVVKPKALFVTEDGVEIFEGGECWIVEEGNNSPYKWEQIIKDGMNEGEKYFASKRAAEDYIFLNKACLSVNDVKSIVSSGWSIGHGPTMSSFENDKLVKLAKSKLK